MAIDLLKYMIWRNGAGGGGGDHEEKTVGPAPILHIEDALKRPLSAYTFDVNPIQDLNGQSSPYPAGGGKNLANVFIDGYVPSVSNGQLVEASGGRSDFIAVESSTAYTLSCSPAHQLYLFEYDADKTFINYSVGNPSCTKTTSAAGKYLMVRIADFSTTDKAQLEKGSTVTAFAPFENICPIYGWKTVNVWNDPKYGGNIEFNQWFIAPYPAVLSSGITFTRDEAKTTSTFFGTATSTVYKQIDETPQTIIDHYYYVDKGSTSTAFRLYNDGGGVDTTVNSQYGLGKATAAKKFYFNILNGSVVDETVKCQIIDLTQMFGAGNEPTTVEEFRALFPKDYYPYNAGEHTCVSAVNGGKYGKYPITFGVLSANKWDEQWETGLIGWTGQDAESSSAIRSKGFMPVSEGNVYRVVTSNNLQFFYYDSNKNFVSYEPSSKANNSTIAIPEGCAYIRFYTYGSTYGGTYKNDIAINYPSTVTTYNPYVDTVYGGTVDTVNSTVTATHEIVTFDGSDSEAWGTYSTTIIRTYRSYSTYGWKGDASCLSNMFANGGETYFPANGKFGWKNEANTFYLQFRLNGITDDRSEDGAAVAKWKAFLSEMASKGTPLTVSLALYEPQTYPITPETVITLYKGENNIWADSGDSTGTYVSSDPYKETVGPAQIVSVTNALKKPAVSLIASMTPVQDLNGQTSPYPPGGGKNKLDDSSYTQLIATSFANHTFTGTETVGNTNSAFVRTYKNGSTINTYDVTKSNLVAGQRVDFTIVFDSSFDSFDVGFKLSSVNNCAARFANNFPDGTYTISFLVDVIPEVGTAGKFSYVQIESGSTPTSWSPYSNICPITGRTGVTVERTGKNLFDVSRFGNADNLSVFPSLATLVTMKTFIKAGAYTFSLKKASSTVSHAMNYIINGSRSSLANVATGDITRTITANYDQYFEVGFITNGSTEAQRIQQVVDYYANGLDDDWQNIQLTIGSTAPDAYYPYIGATYPVVFPDTVYGCTVDAVTGEGNIEWVDLTLDGVNKVLNVASTSYIGATTTRGYITNPPYNSKTGVSSMEAWSMCSAAKFVGSVQETGVQSFQIAPNSVEINFRILNSLTGVTSADTAAEARTKLNAYLAENPITVVYAVKDPVPFTLTPTQIELLKGANTLWSDADDLTLTYLAKKETQSLGNSAPLLFGGLNLGNALNDTNQETPQETVVDSVDGDPNEE